MRQPSQRLAIFLMFAAMPLFLAASAFAQANAPHEGKHSHGAASQPAAVVKIVDFTFDPATVTIKAGQTVEWQNDGMTGHSVTDDPSKAKDKADAALPEGAKSFNSGALKHGASFHHMFMVPGTYKYFCMGHEGKGMLGTVVVEPVAGGAHHGASPRSTGSDTGDEQGHGSGMPY